MAQRPGESLRQWVSRIERNLNKVKCCSEEEISSSGGAGSPFAIVGSGLPSYDQPFWRN